MSGISEPIYDLHRKIDEEFAALADKAITRSEDALLASLKALWDENEPNLDHEDTDQGWHEYGAAVGARTAVAAIAKDFDLLDDLVKHDVEAGRYA